MAFFPWTVQDMLSKEDTWFPLKSFPSKARRQRTWWSICFLPIGHLVVNNRQISSALLLSTEHISILCITHLHRLTDCIYLLCSLTNKQWETCFVLALVGYVSILTWIYHPRTWYLWVLSIINGSECHGLDGRCLKAYTDWIPSPCVFVFVARDGTQTSKGSGDVYSLHTTILMCRSKQCSSNWTVWQISPYGAARIQLCLLLYWWSCCWRYVSQNPADWLPMWD